MWYNGLKELALKKQLLTIFLFLFSMEAFVSTKFNKQYNSEYFAITQMIFYGSVQRKDADRVHKEALEKAKVKVAPAIQLFEKELQGKFKDLKTFNVLKFDPQIDVENFDNKKGDKYLFSYGVTVGDSKVASPFNGHVLYLLLENEPSEDDQEKAEEILNRLSKPLRK